VSGSNGLPSTPAHAARPAGVVVVLLPGRATAIDPLVRALARRGLSAVLAADAASVMVELAQQAVTAVVLVEPVVASADRLTDAIARYHGGARVWRYRPPRDGARAMLMPATARPATPVPPRPRAADADPADREAEADADADGPLLTRDELAMLLEPLAERDPPQAAGLRERGGSI